MSTRYWNIAGSFIALYFFISAIMLIKLSAAAMAESLTEMIVLLI